MTGKSRSRSSGPRTKWLHLCVVALALSMIAIVARQVWLINSPGETANVALVADSYRNLVVREHAAGTWTGPRPWTGSWDEIDTDAARIIVSADGYVPEMFDVAKHRNERLPDLKQLAFLSVAVQGPGNSVVAGEEVTARRLGLGEYAQELAELEPAFKDVTVNETADNGVTEIQLIPNINYEITLPDQSVEELGILIRTREVTLKPGERRSIAFTPLSAGDALVGWVQTPDGEPCSNARVALRSWQETSGVSLTQDLMVARTGPNGVFALEGKVPQAMVRVADDTAEPGRHSLWIEWKPPAGTVVRGRFAVEPWAGIHDIGPFILPDNVTIKIRAIQNGKPLSGATVKLWVYEELELEALTDNDGFAAFPGLPTGLPADCLVESPGKDRKRADLAHLMAAGGTVEVDLPYSVAIPAGTVTFEFDRKAHGFADNEVLTIMYQIYEPGVPSRKWAGGGEKLTGAGKSTAVVGPPGEYLFWIRARSMRDRPRKAISVPQRVRLSAGDTHEIKCEFFEWAEIYIDTDISPDAAAVFAGVRTPDRLTIMGDAELTGSITTKRGPVKYIIPPHCDLVLEVYAEPKGVPRSPYTRKWHQIELEPFKPGEVRAIKIDQFWSD
ncbi:MAG: carboxypeptidase regulatory-like domain-containing protein [Planctomycetes bacterium]|nr:carboxypeptidase regulatory-like domain-containing protein [Planctomycetota bacterium]MCW8134655.1 carboxypeptidase regulatory-like domain-containing protein [Planctomycetota bacterium]